MKLRVNVSQFKGVTTKAHQILLPNSNGEYFWYPKRLIYFNDPIATIYIPDNMTFRIMKGKKLVKEADPSDIMKFFK